MRDIRIADIPKPNRGNRYHAPVRNMLQNFLASGSEAYEVNTDCYADEMIAYSSMIQTIKRSGLSDEAWAYLRQGRVFLVRRDAYDAQNG